MSSCFPESSKLIPFMKGDRYGFVDQDLNIVIEAKYDRVFEFNDENYYAVRLNNDHSEIIDMSGNVVFICRSPVVGFIDKKIIWYYRENDIVLYDIIDRREVAHGIQRAFKANDKYIPVSFVEQNFNTYIDENGRILFPNMKFKRTYPFYDGTAIVINNDWNYCLIDDSGEIIKSDFTCLSDNQFNEGLVYAEGYNDEYGYMNTEGEFQFFVSEIFPTDGSSINHTIFSEGYAFVKANRAGKVTWLMLDRDGKEILDNLDFTTIDDFKVGFARVSIKRSHIKYWNFINKAGELLSEVYFEEASDFYGGYSMVKLNGVDFLLDKQGYLQQVN